MSAAHLNIICSDIRIWQTGYLIKTFLGTAYFKYMLTIHYKITLFGEINPVACIPQLIDEETFVDTSGVFGLGRNGREEVGIIQ